MHSIWSKCIKTGIQQQKQLQKICKQLKMNNTLLNNHWMIGKIKKEIKSFLERNENKNMTYQNIWDTAKEVLT
jgi:hypothetical protein